VTRGKAASNRIQSLLGEPVVVTMDSRRRTLFRVPQCEEQAEIGKSGLNRVGNFFGELARFTDGFLRLSAISDPECAETGLVCDKNCSTVARLFYRVRAFKLAPTVRRTGASDD